MKSKQGINIFCQKFCAMTQRMGTHAHTNDITRYITIDIILAGEGNIISELLYTMDLNINDEIPKRCMGGEGLHLEAPKKNKIYVLAFDAVNKDIATIYDNERRTLAEEEQLK